MVARDQGDRSLVKSGLRVGLFLYENKQGQQVSQLMEMLGIPKLTSGTGARHSVLKRDKCAAVIDKVFADTVSQEEKQRMILMMVMGRQKAPEADAECPNDVLDAVLELDADNQPHFKNMYKAAAKEKETRKQLKSLAQPPADTHDDPAVEHPRKRRCVRGAEDPLDAAPAAPAAALAAPLPVIPRDDLLVAHEGSSAGRWKMFTPPQLVPLIPGNNELPYVYLRRSSTKYSAVYQIVLDYGGDCLILEYSTVHLNLLFCPDCFFNCLLF